MRTNDPTKLWRSVRTKLNPNSNSQINSLCVNGTIIDRVSDILASFKNHFSVSVVGMPLKAINLCLNLINAHFLLYFVKHTASFDFKPFAVAEVIKS